MKLADLEPRFVRYETRVGTWTRCVGDAATWKEGDPTEEVTGPQQWTIPVDSFAEAQGILFLCPMHFAQNSGPGGTHALDVTFDGRGVADDQGSHNGDRQPSRWTVSGNGFDDLTLTPSIDIGCWHGHITNGEIR